MFDGQWEIEEFWVGGQLTTYKEKPDQIIFTENKFVWRNYLGEYLEIEGKWLIKSQNSSGKLVLLKHGKDGTGSTVYMRGLFKFTNNKLLLIAHDFEWPPHFGVAGSKESEFALLVLRRRK